jgi:hypothetical protein
VSRWISTRRREAKAAEQWFCPPDTLWRPAPQQELAIETQVPPQALNPALQVKAQALPSQVAVPLAVAGQAVQEDPQADTLVLLWHDPPHK